jgi:hypothetical protein
VVQSLDRHVPSDSRGRARRSRPTVLASWTWLAEETQGDEGAAKLQEVATGYRIRVHHRLVAFLRRCSRSNGDKSISMLVR